MILSRPASLRFCFREQRLDALPLFICEVAALFPFLDGFTAKAYLVILFIFALSMMKAYKETQATADAAVVYG